MVTAWDTPHSNPKEPELGTRPTDIVVYVTVCVHLLDKEFYLGRARGFAKTMSSNQGQCFRFGRYPAN